jgi:hypothetical protein
MGKLRCQQRAGLSPLLLRVQPIWFGTPPHRTAPIQLSAEPTQMPNDIQTKTHPVPILPLTSHGDHNHYRLYIQHASHISAFPYLSMPPRALESEQSNPIQNVRMNSTLEIEITEVHFLGVKLLRKGKILRTQIANFMGCNFSTIITTNCT